MNYYRFFPGDYLRDTLHLGWLEDLAYRRLLDLAYSRQRPIPNDRQYIMRAVRASEPEQQTAVDTVLSEFWTLKADGWHQGKVDQQLENMADRSRKASDAARTRWDKDLTDANAMRTHSDGNADAMLSTPLHSTPKKENINTSRPRPSAEDLIPYQKIVDLYHQKLPQLPKVYALTEARKASIRARWRDGSCPDLEAWGAFFEVVAKSNFLTGQARPTGDRKPVRADLEWLTRESNFVKVLEGRYHHA